MNKMIDFDKLQKDVLAGLLKGNKAKDGRRWMLASDKEHVYLSNGCFIAKIPTENFMLTVNADLIGGFNIAAAKNIEKESENTRPVVDSGIEKQLDNKKTVRLFKNDKGQDIAVDVEFLKYFSGMTYTTTGTDPKSPIYLKRDGVFIGTILPVNLKAA